MSENGTVCSTNCNSRSTRLIGEEITEDFPPRGRMVNFQTQPDDFVALSEREREVLQCIAAGLSSKQCAQELGIAPRTVSVTSKTSATSSTHATSRTLSPRRWPPAISKGDEALPIFLFRPAILCYGSSGDQSTVEQECA